MNNAWAISLAAVVLVVAVGCTPDNEEFVSKPRLDNGLVVILPGIEGVGGLSESVRNGLDSAGINYALMLYQWGRPVPLFGPILNQTDFVGNRLAGERIALLIANYQETHPGKPVYVVGHSGGGGVAVFTAEAMPEGQKLDGLVLLSASISSGYDLGKALAHSRNGLVNFYSNGDVGLLVVGTTLLGNVDGVHGPSAGAGGFSNQLPGVYQVGWTEAMASTGNDGGHSGSCQPRFIQGYVAPWLTAKTWPAR